MKGTFDYCAIQHYSGYPERIGRCVHEMRRIGATAVVHEQFPTPVDEFILERISHQRNVTKETLSCTLGHYRILKTAYEEGAESVLAVEDDVLFPKDVTVFEQAVAELPRDWEVAKFEWFFGRSHGAEERAAILGRERHGGRWIDGRGVKAVGNGCYAMKRKAMKWKIGLIEDAFVRPGRGKLRVCDMYDRPWPSDAVRMYLAVPLAAIQGTNERTVNEKMKDYEGFMLEEGREAYGA